MVVICSKYEVFELQVQAESGNIVVIAKSLVKKYQHSYKARTRPRGCNAGLHLNEEDAYLLADEGRLSWDWGIQALECHILCTKKFSTP